MRGRANTYAFGDGPGEAPGFRQAAGSHCGWRTRRVVASFWQISAKCCSFSAVSAPIFARKDAFCSIFQNRPDYLAEIFDYWQNFANFANVAKSAKFAN